MRTIIQRSLIILLVIFSIKLQTYSQSNSNNWVDIPGLGPESPLSLTNEKTFCGVIGAAALSYALAEFVLKDVSNSRFYQCRLGLNKEYFWGFRNVAHQNFGVENRLAPWFAIAAEFNFQQWNDKTPSLKGKNKSGIGIGIMTYYRWYLFGKKRLSPYLEYGTGLFYGFKKFPYNGTNFTFSHSTQIGLEYTFKNRNKMRLGYGQFHQSNNSWLSPNPGYDANGFSISYSWFWF